MFADKDFDEFDRENEHRLKRLWFVGDPHNDFSTVELALDRARQNGSSPRWVILLGDQDLVDRSLAKVTERFKRIQPSVNVAFIPGNHDADTHEKWSLMMDSGDAKPLHGLSVHLDGINVAGLGGNFLGRVWYPPAEPVFRNRAQAFGGRPVRQKPSPSLSGAIYPDEVASLAKFRADILVTHEAPSCHHHGWEVFDDLARSLRVKRLFHGHTHDDNSAAFKLERNRMGFEVVTVNSRSIKNGLGEIVYEYAPERAWQMEQNRDWAAP